MMNDFDGMIKDYLGKGNEVVYVEILIFLDVFVWVFEVYGDDVQVEFG